MYCYTFNLYFRLCQWHWIDKAYLVESKLFLNTESMNVTKYIKPRTKNIIENMSGISIIKERIETNNQQVDKMPS